MIALRVFGRLMFWLSVVMVMAVAFAWAWDRSDTRNAMRSEAAPAQEAPLQSVPMSNGISPAA